LSARCGFDEFRPHQEQACRTICSGEDVLLVMPTGAGKSLCYQLPGIARAGTTLVVSPLIALMEDQVIKLQQQGFAAERIHSGRSREQSREVCRDYLSGNLDFLFIAPERLSVPGFPEMLGKRKPTLIAIDEAHCISQWGHDFRPDYRMLNERLPLLRPAPIVALTATATPRVQNDIIEQLAAPKAHRFIHGFRRDNIAIEVVEMKPSLRNDSTKRLLSLKGRTPAIVYAPTRKKAEQLADELGEAFPTAAYHAGMTPDRRDKVQSAFLSGTLDVIVATVAFGMGIDKANVRTVVHLALPASVENYYQEIGRSGRDGKPARAFLLHGFIDRRTHEWFFERDYPDIKLLTKLFSLLSDKPISRDQLQKKAKMDGDTFEKALEKLWIHGGAIVTPNEYATRGPDGWREPYRAQIEHRRGQLEEMARFADTRSCRMQRLVRHFGDQADSGEPCGQCDTCAPNETLAQESIEATSGQIEAMERILKTLATDRAPSSGRLHSELFGTKLDRDKFEILLAALHRAGLVHIEEDQFESEGRKIEFQRPVITTSGRRANAGDVANVRIPSSGESGQSKKRRSSRKKPGTRSKTSPKKRTRKSVSPPRAAGASPSALAQELRALRLTEAERRGIPAFRIFNDKVLEAISDAMPATSDELMEVKGVGPALTKKYGSRILRVVAGASKK
jgi:DNA topoisomerase-3